MPALVFNIVPKNASSAVPVYYSGTGDLSSYGSGWLVGDCNQFGFNYRYVASHLAPNGWALTLSGNTLQVTVPPSVAVGLYSLNVINNYVVYVGYIEVTCMTADPLTGAPGLGAAGTYNISEVATARGGTPPYNYAWTSSGTPATSNLHGPSFTFPLGTTGTISCTISDSGTPTPCAVTVLHSVSSPATPPPNPSPPGGVGGGPPVPPAAPPGGGGTGTGGTGTGGGGGIIPQTGGPLIGGIIPAGGDSVIVGGYGPSPAGAPGGAGTGQGWGGDGLGHGCYNGVSWVAVTGALSYTVERAPSATGTFAAIATGLTTLSYSDPTSHSVTGTPYFYRVRAVNAVGTSDPSAVVEVLTYCPLPAPPVWGEVCPPGQAVTWTEICPPGTAIWTEACPPGAVVTWTQNTGLGQVETG